MNWTNKPRKRADGKVVLERTVIKNAGTLGGAYNPIPASKVPGVDLSIDVRLQINNMYALLDELGNQMKQALLIIDDLEQLEISDYNNLAAGDMATSRAHTNYQPIDWDSFFKHLDRG